jgi:nitroimidazol reductase NimA-like FMN-containing flavoprotein (pyridoxamine 5'-phosphate oxidase superfamily)
LIEHGAGLEQQQAREALDDQATLIEIFMQALFEIGSPGLKMLAAVDSVSARFIDQVVQHRAGFAAAQDQLPPHVPQFLIQGLQTVMKPPAAGTAQAPIPGRLVVEDVTGQHGPAGGSGGGKSGEVVSAEVLAKPVNNWCAHGLITLTGFSGIICHLPGYTSVTFDSLSRRITVQVKGPWAEHEISDFLDTATFPLRLATVGKDGFPRVVSVWYLADGLNLQCVSHRDSQLVKLLRANNRVGFEVAPNEPPYHGVRGQGIATLSPLGERDALDRMVERYLGGAESAVANWLLSRREEELHIHIEPVRLFSWDYRERMSDVDSSGS